eukprot:11418762-Karenia_brevis.AAC.1
MSFGGVFWAADCHIKALRSAVSSDGGGLSQKDLVAAAQARLCVTGNQRNSATNDFAKNLEAL